MVYSTDENAGHLQLIETEMKIYDENLEILDRIADRVQKHIEKHMPWTVGGSSRGWLAAVRNQLVAGA